MTLPLAAHGVGIERLSRCARGIRASIWLRVSRVRATSPSSRANAAMPSRVRLNSGTTNPPRPSAPKITSSAAVAWVRPCCEVGVQYHLHAVETAHPLGHPGRGHRQGDPPRPPFGRDEVEHHQQRPVIADHRALVVHQLDPLADLVEPDAERGPGRGDQLGQALHAGPQLGQALRR